VQETEGRVETHRVNILIIPTGIQRDALQGLDVLDRAEPTLLPDTLSGLPLG